MNRRAAEAGAAHAALVERAAGLAAEVQRLEDAAVDLESRATALTDELGNTRRRIDRSARRRRRRRRAARSRCPLPRGAPCRGGSSRRCRLDTPHRGRRTGGGDQDSPAARSNRCARRSRSSIFSEPRQKATSSHLASACVAAVQATLDEVLVEATELEREGKLTSHTQALEAEESEEDIEGGEETFDAGPAAAVVAAEQQTLSAEEAIARLRAKIDRLGPVNMMAIEQYDELETRHTFLTTQRKDLVDSISQTTEAISRIDETTRQRFSEAFAAINRNFQEMFTTLFGGGRAGLTLLDENDPLESGIEIVAQPPGKRLQSVQLLSGGEKALTAISLMFGLFKYKPSPFCLLDEIDAPLDDANIGRFVGMLRSMQEHTQFILITHNRKTMEIADRLYGVTMEEPGVSKLISVQLN